jgi:dUTP pyrophosphatase
MSVKVKFAKVKEGAIIPSKRDEDMGFDIYACFDEDYIEFKPHETKLIPTGIASACDPEYGFLLRERGSTGSKGIALRAGVIDSGYRNEWFVGLTNTTEHPLYISKLNKEELVEKAIDALGSDAIKKLFGSFTKDYWENVVVYPYAKAIAQALIVPVPKIKVEEIPYKELQAIKSERGMGALGSSNK